MFGEMGKRVKHFYQSQCGMKIMTGLEEAC